MGLRDLKLKSAYGPQDDRLHAFYIPALSVSQSYERCTGYFSSYSLAVAAQGVAHLVKNDGTMRLLVGAKLDKHDVEAIREGHGMEGRVRARLLSTLEEPGDRVTKKRLQVLAWMVAEGLLAIRVVLPVGQDGEVLSVRESQDYFHPKEGLFTDTHGDQVSFSGSINESIRGWEHNYEQFNVFFSWGEGQTYLRKSRLRFRRLWEGIEPGWKSMPIPEAVEEKLLAYRPTQIPVRDPLEQKELEQNPPSPKSEEALLFRFIKDAPRLPDASWLGVATSAVEPWPHQEQVVEEAAGNYPERFLFCDEVGLGKTIEAGLVLRELLLTGTVERVLLLVPKSLGRQWQEELYEKFQLQVPMYLGNEGYKDVFGHDLEVRTENPWEAFPVLLASSQLAKREERREEILSAEPWDLVLVDEAHHARRRDFREKRYRPNCLLELLTQLTERTEGMLLLTATPMQISPVEVWDLLRVLGVGGRWGASEDHFINYYRELRLPPSEIDWEFMLHMFRDYLESGGTIDPEFLQEAVKALGPVEWKRIESLPYKKRRETVLNNLSAEGTTYLHRLLREHTPLTRFSYRNTRRLLHQYRRQGLLEENVPRRVPKPEWIPMTSAEKTLYERIEEYISDFYKRYEEERRGLGFVMTVYRRRLTSSFYAMQESLKRRRDFLEGRMEDWLQEEDTEIDDLELDITETMGEPGMDEELALYSEEIAFINDFLSDLAGLEGESKIEVLLDDLHHFFRERDKVIIFTQYTDTMDFIRGKLQAIYGRQVACYSGRGGERWNGTCWEEVDKEAIKTAFLSGQKLKILVCTEAASEGLNLQTCGVLINYDMPWNPMRVEQRIGRIDRIGQVHDQVFIKNYFYEETVEAEIYRRLGDRISWFEDVVGRLQPILGRVREAIESVAMSAKTDRPERMEAIDAIERELEKEATEDLDIDRHLGQASLEKTNVKAPVDLRQLESLLTTSECTGHLFLPHPEKEDVYQLAFDQDHHEVTFTPDVFEQHPYTLRLMTYGEPLFDTMLERIVEEFDETWPDRILRLQGDDGGVAYYVRQGDDIRYLASFDTVQRCLKEDVGEGPWTDDALKAARNDLAARVQDRKKEKDETRKQRRQSRWTAFVARGRLLLSQAALIKGLLVLDEGRENLESCQRQGFALLKAERKPFTGIMNACGIQSPQNLEMPEGKFAGETPRSLVKRYEVCKKQAQELINEVAAFRDTAQ